jgi:hypothetical protein
MDTNEKCTPRTVLFAVARFGDIEVYVGGELLRELLARENHAGPAPATMSDEVTR